MITSYTLSTSEIDSPSEACEEILQQLAQLQLKEHTVGIVACHYDSVESGVIAALQNTLPFVLIGCTTFYKATPEASGLFDLTITLLTSDTVRFGTYYSDESEKHVDTTEKVVSTYHNAYQQYDEKPSLIVSFISANRPITGDEFLRVLDEASGSVPSFGFVDSGEDESGANTYIICRDKVFSDGLALLLFVGEVEASMYTTNPLDEGLLSLTATVTKAEGTLVREINDQPALSYLRKHGIELEPARDEIVTFLPLYFHESKTDSYISRMIRSIHEDGTLECMAEVPEGALLRAGTITSEDIQKESSKAIQLALSENPQAAVALIASCVGRFITLGLDITLEIEEVTSKIPSQMNYMACYVGGEICPVKKNDELKNCYHNNTLTLLMLR